MSVYQIVGYCLTAFGLGYAGGAIRRIARQAIESLDKLYALVTLSICSTPRRCQTGVSLTALLKEIFT